MSTYPHRVTGRRFTGAMREFAALIVVLLIAGCATPPPAAQPVPVDPLRISNPKPGFTLALRPERTPLHIGDRLQLTLQASADSYLNLYFISTSGKTGQLLTNYPVRANEAVTFPPAGGKKLQYALAAPTGAETLVLAATRQPLNLFGRADIKNLKKPRTPVAEFNLSGPQLLSRLRGALHRRPPADWNAYGVQLPLLPAAP